MPKERNPTIVDIMSRCSRMVRMLTRRKLCLFSNILKAVRQSIYDNIEEFVAIVEDPEFKKYFPVIGGIFENKLGAS